MSSRSRAWRWETLADFVVRRAAVATLQSKEAIGDHSSLRAMLP